MYTQWHDKEYQIIKLREIQVRGWFDRVKKLARFCLCQSSMRQAGLGKKPVYFYLPSLGKNTFGKMGVKRFQHFITFAGVKQKVKTSLLF